MNLGFALVVVGALAAGLVPAGTAAPTSGRAAPPPPADCRVLRDLYGNCTGGVATVAAHDDDGDREARVLEALTVRHRGRWYVAVVTAANCVSDLCQARIAQGEVGVAVYARTLAGRWRLRDAMADVVQLGEFGEYLGDPARIRLGRSRFMIRLPGSFLSMGFAGTYDVYLGYSFGGLELLTVSTYIGTGGDNLGSGCTGGECYEWSGVTSRIPAPGSWPTLVVDLTGTRPGPDGGPPVDVTGIADIYAYSVLDGTYLPPPVGD
jgi:hypothetical protein